MKMSQTHQVLIVKQDLATSGQLSSPNGSIRVFGGWTRRCYDGPLSPVTVERTKSFYEDVMTLNLSWTGSWPTRESER